MSAEEDYPRAEPEAVTQAVEEGQRLVEGEDVEPPVSPEPSTQVSTLPASATHTERDPSEDEDPTFSVEPWAGLTHYTCLLDGHEDWHIDSFTQHMQLYHKGIMRVAPAGPEPGPEDAASAAVDAAEESAGSAPETEAAEPEASPEAPAEAEGGR